VTVTSSSTTSSTGSTTTSDSATTQTTQTSISAPVVHLSTFKSPSGNIGCIMYSDGARCDIHKRSWSPPPRPSSCTTQVDFGQGVGVGSSGVARIVCAGDTTFDPSAPPLPYGTDSLAGGFRCQSRTGGMSCRNVSSGHGFFISAQSYRLF
jgi:hypothetical protein